MEEEVVCKYAFKSVKYLLGNICPKKDYNRASPWDLYACSVYHELINRITFTFILVYSVIC